MAVNGVPSDDFPDPTTLEHEYHAAAIDPDDQPVATVLKAVAAVSDTAPVDLPPLYDVVDPDALNALVARSSASLCLRFTYDSYDVVLEDDTVYVRPLDPAASACGP